jgi:ElaA protein
LRRVSAGSPYDAVTVRTAAFPELDGRTLYEILRLRSEVFVVEQDCAFLDLDRRDLDAGVTHLWLEGEGEVIAYARIIPTDQGTEVGRIVVREDQRGLGVGTRLMREATGLAGAHPPVLVKAQARLLEWYEALGFEMSGRGYLEDGIAHVPMRLAAN